MTFCKITADNMWNLQLIWLVVVTWVLLYVSLNFVADMFNMIDKNIKSHTSLSEQCSLSADCIRSSKLLGLETIIFETAALCLVPPAWDRWWTHHSAAYSLLLLLWICNGLDKEKSILSPLNICFLTLIFVAAALLTQLSYANKA